MANREQLLLQLNSEVPYLRGQAVFLLGEGGFFDTECIEAVEKLIGDSAKVPMLGIVDDQVQNYLSMASAA